MIVSDCHLAGCRDAADARTMTMPVRYIGTVDGTTTQHVWVVHEPGVREPSDSEAWPGNLTLFRMFPDAMDMHVRDERERIWWYCPPCHERLRTYRIVIQEDPF